VWAGLWQPRSDVPEPNLREAGEQQEWRKALACLAATVSQGCAEKSRSLYPNLRHKNPAEKTK